MKTELQRIMAHQEDESGGWYEHPEMLVRLAQLGLINARGISMTEVANFLSTSRETLSKYFQGYTPNFGRKERTEFEQMDYAHDLVEEAIELISEERNLEQDLVDPEEALRFSTAITEHYMAADHKRWKLRG